MKNAFFVLMALATFSFASCDKNENTSSPYELEILDVAEDGASSILVNNYEDALSIKSDSILDESSDGLLFLLEEEKMAHDLYVSFFNTWNLNVFDRISNSESTHFEAVKTLLDSYEIEFITSNELGVFYNEDIQNLYNSFIEEGSQLVENALVVGAKVEEYDIADLMSEIEHTTNEDMLLLYNNLLIGSRNHLRAFYKNMQMYGISYTPTYLDQSLFDEIVNSDHERGQTCTMNTDGGNQYMHQNRHQNRGGRS